MSAKNKTIVFIGVCIVAIIAWDIWTIVANGLETSISQVMIDWAYDYPVFPFTMGFVMGHLFWKISEIRKGK